MPIHKISSLIGRGKSKANETPATEPVDAGCQLITVSRIASLMQEMGYRGKVVVGEEWSWVESATNGTKFNIYCFSEKMSDPDSEAHSIQFDGGWGGLSSYDARRFLMVCNRFNHDWRYAKACVATDHDRYSLSVKLDHHCLNGLTNEEFFVVADMFVRLIGDMAKRTMSAVGDTFSALIDRHKEATGLMWGADADPDQALAIYLENARAGYAGSMISLGDYYENSIDITQSAPVAAHFYTRAAERGQPLAYYGLARILAQDAQDEDVILEAAKFALLAFRDLPDGQNRHAAEMLKDHLLDKLSNDGQEMAIKLAGTWLPLTVEGGPIDAEAMLDYGRSPSSSTLN
jgi:hypothetical protein